MSKPVRLTIAVRTHGHTAALKDGRVKMDGVEFDFIEVEPQIAAFRRMVRDVEFDVCELAPTTYFIARAYGAPYKALPIFFERRFHHAGLVVRPDADINGPKDLEGKKVGVIAGSSHEAYLKAMFTDAELHSYPSDDALRLALRRGEVDFIFGDAISLAFWINGTDSDGCCAFSGGPFVESRYFGEGIGIGVRKGNDLLRQALNWALFRVWEKGRYTDLWLRYFSVSPF